MSESLFSDLIWLTDENGNPIDFGAPHGPANLLPDILPSNSGPFERALALAMSDGLPVPFRQVMDPATTTERFLPFRAAHESVDLWYSDWPDDRKRKIIADWPHLAKLIGTRAAAQRFLDYVDAEVVHKVSYPATKPVGRIAAGITPIQHPKFTARFLVKVALQAPANAILVGRTAVGRAAIRTIDREPLRRAKRALSISKAPETAYTVTFAHRVPRTLDDGFDLDAGLALGSFRNRIRL